MKVLTAGGQWAPVDLAGQASSFIEGTDVTLERTGSIELIPGPDGAGRTVSYRKVYESNPWLWAAIHLIARSFGRMPSKLFDVDEDGHKTRIRPNADTYKGSLALALRRPGNRRSWQSNQHATSIDRIVEGAGVWFINRDRRGFYLGFDRIPYKFLRYEKILGVERYWDSRHPDKKRISDDVIHFGANSENGLWAPSAIAAMPTTLQLYDAIQRHLVSFFGNSMRPSAHVEVDKNTSKEARQLIRDAIKTMYAGPDNSGRVLITSGKWSPMTQQHDHSQIIELLKMAREEIAAGIGAPAPLVGILDNAIMSNVRELRSHHVRDVVGPHVAEWEGDLDAQVLAMDDQLADVSIAVEQAAMLQADPEARAGAYKNRRLIESINEIRDTEDLAPIDHPDADVPWMPLNESPLGDEDPDKKEKKDDDEDEDA